MSKPPYDDLIKKAMNSGLFGQNNFGGKPFKAGNIDWKTGRQMSDEEVAQKNSQNDIEIKDPPTVFKSPNVDSNEDREVVDLTGHMDEIRLFVVQSLSSALKALMNRVHSEGSSAAKILNAGDIVLKPNATYDAEYEVNITEIHKIVFDIHVKGDLTSSITMRQSDAKVDIENFHKMDVDEVVKSFIKDADILEVLYD